MTQVSDYISLRIETVKVKNQGKSCPYRCMSSRMKQSIRTISVWKTHREKASLASKGITITQNAANVLHFDEGDVVQLQNLKLVQEGCGGRWYSTQLYRKYSVYHTDCL